MSRLLTGWGEPPYRARQIFSWLHRRGAASLEEMTDLPAALRKRLAGSHPLATLRLDKVVTSVDGSRKYRFLTTDDLVVESVYIPVEGSRATLCLSTQVGCAMGCSFCLTGVRGLARSLTAGEMVDQVYRGVRDLAYPAEKRPLSNLVLMGMGEPLANYRQTITAIGLLLHPLGMRFSRRHVTLSTAGLVPAIERLMREEVQVNLSVSLNAPRQDLRRELMPVPARHSLERLMETCRRYPLDPQRRITFEYVMLAGVNDSLTDARDLARLIRGVKCKVNLIPFNECPGVPFRRPSTEVIDAFARELLHHRVRVQVRQSRGSDVGAACGQLGGLDLQAQK